MLDAGAVSWMVAGPGWRNTAVATAGLGWVNADAAAAPNNNVYHIRD